MLITNAAGSLNAEVGPGRLMAIADHINLLGVNPLTGPNDDAIGPRFPSLRDAYDPELRAKLQTAAQALDIDARRGRLPRHRRPDLRDPGRDPHVPHARRRRRRDVYGSRGDPRPPRRAARRRGLGDHEPRRGDGRRGALARADAAQRRSRGARPRAARPTVRGGTAMLAPEVIRKKRDGAALTTEEITFLVGGITDGGLSDAQVGALAMAFFLKGLDADERLALTTRDARQRQRPGLGPRQARAGQALDRRRRRQGEPDARADPRRLRGRGADDQRPRARPHRRDARQARQHPRLHLDARHRGHPPRGARRRLRDRRPDRGPRPRRPPPVRDPGRHRHGRVDLADRRVDPLQEARRGPRRARARRQDRLRRLHGQARGRGRARAGAGRGRQRRGREDRSR